MMTAKTLWLFLVLVVTAMNAWAAYMTTTHGFSLIPRDAMIVGMFAGLVTYVLGRVIIK